MASRIQSLSIGTLVICVLSTWMICLPLFAQDFAVAFVSPQAGESADDDPEDTGDRNAVDAVDDAAQRAAETLNPRERAEALKRRAGEQVAGQPRGRANVLGMSLQEAGRGRVQVIDVAAASPAFDAGVRKGDEIVSFDGFRGESYRDWIDGMGRLVTDTPDGETIAIELLRGGKRVAARIRAPEARADDPRLPGLLAPMPQQGLPGVPTQSGQPGIPQPNQPLVGGSGSDVFINNAPFSEAFNAGDGNVNDRAMAEIVRLSPQQQSAPADNLNAGTNAQQRAGARGVGPQQPTPPNATSGEAGRIGVAGFRNDANGLLVMIDIAGLEPGSYRVGIDDPGVVIGSDSTVTGGVPTGIVTPPNRANQIDLPAGNQPAVPQNGAGVKPGTAQPNPADAGAPQADGRTDQSDIPPSGLARPLSTPPSGLARPLSTPPSGQTRPLTSTPTGLPDTRQPGRADTPPGESSQGGTLSQIGVLTVDQSGTGRLQQVVEGVQVAEIVGQAIVIYAPARPPQTAIPPDPNVSGVREGAGDPNVPAESQATAGATQAPRQNAAAIAGAAQVNGATQPVAAGVIRLLSDRRPALGATDSPTGELTPQAQQPTGTELIERAALPQQQPR
jgi:hypothetical protein